MPQKPSNSTGWDCARTYFLPCYCSSANGEKCQRFEVFAKSHSRHDRETEQGPFAGGGRSTKEMLEWLAEIWLDPEVRKTLDADVWLKLYESLKDGK
jgi:hypothetical protein